jgi:hypothetical protein
MEAPPKSNGERDILRVTDVAPAVRPSDPILTIRAAGHP